MNLFPVIGMETTLRPSLEWHDNEMRCPAEPDLTQEWHSKQPIKAWTLSKMSPSFPMTFGQDYRSIDIRENLFCSLVKGNHADWRMAQKLTVLDSPRRLRVPGKPVCADISAILNHLWDHGNKGSGVPGTVVMVLNMKAYLQRPLTIKPAWFICTQ